MIQLVFEVAVAMSRKWDSEEAGKEVAKNLLSRMSNKPKFILLFSTIHYKKNGGFQKLLDGVRSVLADEVPLIGGTVSGFIVEEGCYCRGVVAACVFDDKMSVAPFFFRNTRQNPSKAGESLSSSLSKIEGREKMILSFMSGPSEPTLLSNSSVNSFFKKIPLPIFWPMRDVMLAVAMRFLKYGPAREEEVFGGFQNLDDFKFAGTSLFDDLKALTSYQFFNKDYAENSLVALGISGETNFEIRQETQLNPLKRAFRIKRGGENFCIDLINGQPAVEGYLKEMGWKGEHSYSTVKQHISSTFYYPFGFEISENLIYAFPPGLFNGHSIITNRKINEDDVNLYLTSERKIIGSYERLAVEDGTNFLLVFQGFHAIGILGAKIQKIRELLKEKSRNVPYLLIFGSGEYSKEKMEKPVLTNYGVVFTKFKSS